MKRLRTTRSPVPGLGWLLAVLCLAILAGVAVADVPGDWTKNPDGTWTLIAPRQDPAGSAVPNPGTQQQELANITADMGPVFYNVFEFPVTCSECHSGVIDQQVGHLTNWGGSSMASATRDPVFRANQIIVEKTVEGILGEGGIGNMCFRCHSPNGWYSGRFDPAFGGAPDGHTIIHSILPSTDDEGIMCETCHRTIGNVTTKRPDLDPNDPVWNMLAGISDWTHSGGAYPAGPLTGDPYGDATLQLSDGMTYGATWLGNVTPFWSDVPPTELAGTPYTGQTYGIYPPGYTDPFTGLTLGGQPAVTPEGASLITYEQMATPPPDLYDQAISPEHSTFRNEFIRKPEFCGSCHDLTIPFHVAGFPIGMPEQRTYTEWRYSNFGYDAAGQPAADHKRCQDCHMPRLMHEYTDATPVSLNCDPSIAGWFPYAKERFGGTTIHKFGGGNFGLGNLMKLLYPEVDLEVIGEPTNNDPMLFPGMQSDRSSMWNRFTQNSLVQLKDAVTVEIVPGSLMNVGSNIWQVQVKVTNNTGHKIPSGYPDGRRFWISLDVRAADNTLLYQSGYYEPAQTYSSKGYDFARVYSARLWNDVNTRNANANNKNGVLNRALENQIGTTGQPVALNSSDSATSTANQVMIYEKRTGTLSAGNYIMSPSLLNPTVVFDNRIPPLGWQPAAYSAGGAKFWNYTRASTGLDDTGSATATAPVEDSDRYPAGANYDIVTYTFRVPVGTTPTKARAEVHWQIIPRAFMEHLKDSDLSTLRPEGPPIIYSVNYPLDRNYLSVDYTFSIDGQTINMRPNPLAFARIAADPFAAPPPGNRRPPQLRDNWGGVAFAAWFRTGLGAPFRVAAADTAAVAPGTPTLNGPTQPNGYTVNLSWSQVANADGYVVWTRYGANDATAAWDRIAVLNGAANTSHTVDTVNVGKTYGYKVQAFNGAGMGPESTPVSFTTGAADCPLNDIQVEALTVTGTGNNWVRLEWTSLSQCADGFIIQRQDVDAGGPAGPFAEVGRVANAGLDMPVSFTDTGLKNKTTYNYRVAAYKGVTVSPFTFPVTATTGN